MGRIDCGVRNDHRHRSLDSLPALPGPSLHCRDIHVVERYSFGSNLGRTPPNVFPAAGQHLSSDTGAFGQAPAAPVVDSAADRGLGESARRISCWNWPDDPVSGGQRLGGGVLPELEAGSPAIAQAGIGLGRMPGGRSFESERDTDVPVSSGNSPFPVHADLCRRMVVPEFSSSQRVAFSVHAPGCFACIGTLGETLTRTRTPIAGSDHVVGIALGASYTDFCTGRSAHAERIGTILAGRTWHPALARFDDALAPIAAKAGERDDTSGFC